MDINIVGVKQYKIENICGGGGRTSPWLVRRLSNVAAGVLKMMKDFPKISIYEMTKCQTKKRSTVLKIELLHPKLTSISVDMIALSG